MTELKIGDEGAMGILVSRREISPTEIAAMSEAELVRLAGRATPGCPGWTAVIDANGQFGLMADWLLAELSPVARAKLTFVPRTH